MRLEVGEMWNTYDTSDLFCVTTNATINGNPPKLVMGRGIAVQARDKFPGLDVAFAAAIKSKGNEYGLLVSGRWPEAKLAAFQVKLAFNQAARLDLIEHSARMLAEWCQAHPGKRVDLNLPGTGNGHLPFPDVLALIGPLLPPSVHVWTQQPWRQRPHHALDAADVAELAAIRVTPEAHYQFVETLCAGDPDQSLYGDGGEFGWR